MPYGRSTRRFHNWNDLLRQRTGHYRVILADPPWQYERNLTQAKHAGMTYHKMSLEEIKAMPVSELGHPDGSLLFLWATMPKLPEALAVMSAWGYQYSTVAFVWVKTRGRFLYSGMGFYTKPNTELLLVGRRGKSPDIVDRTIKQILIEPVRVHSQKPDVLRKLIDDLVGAEQPKIELFARFVPHNDPSGMPESLWTENYDSWGDGDFGHVVSGSDRSAVEHRTRNMTGRSWQLEHQQQYYEVEPERWQPPLTPDEEVYLEQQREMGDPEPLVRPPWLEHSHPGGRD